MINIFAILDQKYFWVNSHICHLLQSGCIAGSVFWLSGPSFPRDTTIRFTVQLRSDRRQDIISRAELGETRGHFQLSNIERRTVINPVIINYLPRNVFRNIFKKKCGNNLWLCMAADLICIYHRLGSIGMRWYYQNEMRTLWRIYGWEYEVKDILSSNQN